MKKKIVDSADADVLDDILDDSQENITTSFPSPEMASHTDSEIKQEMDVEEGEIGHVEEKREKSKKEIEEEEREKMQ